MSSSDELYIQECIDIAKQCIEAGDEPFGALLVKDGEVVMREGNHVNTNSDPTHHAELALIRKYCTDYQISDLKDYTLYTSCEPCVMCSGAIIFAGVGRVVYSVSNKQMAEKKGKGIMIACKEVFKNSPYQPDVKGKVLNNEGLQLFE
ncbi:nucleoside deaminase [Halobacillus litoralis]|uniref:nucleoside deaminase n=1 Tax=Halobacillus litoralis TaxID=45668 RepID=UPI001CFEEC6B|nr:nucleoside deaminase [Halobacillus litoralis]